MKKAILFLAILSLLSGCSNNENENQETTNYLIPLKLNNSWTYNATVYNENGSIQNNYTAVFTHTKDTIVSNKNFAKLSISTLSPESRGLVVRNEGYNIIEGVVRSDFGSPFIVSPFFKKVTNNGEIIVTNTYNNEQIKLIGYTDVINVNGRNSYKNEEIYTNSNGIVTKKHIYYLSPSVGWTKIEYFRKKTNSNDMYMKESLNLNSYVLN